MQGGERYYSISDYLRSEFGRKTVKISLDAGFTCPNRDGSKGFGGCAFCSEGGSGELSAHLADYVTGQELSASLMSESITEQINRLSDKWPDAAYIAYFQSFTNTYASVEYLRKKYYEALSDPRISGIAIATRPDCLPFEVLDLLEEINRDHFLWVEIGLQSIHSETQKAMNLCYTTEDYDKAVAELSKRGIKYVTHIILGLPGENENMIFDSLNHVCNKDPHPFGLKLHLMNIVESSALYKTMPDYVSFNSIDEYVDLVIRCLEIIPDDITIHRLTGDVPRKILVSPEWSYRKRTILNSINKELSLRETYQGSKYIKKAAGAAVNK